MRLPWVALLTIVVTIALAVKPAGQTVPLYSYTDLDAGLDDFSAGSTLVDINELGQILGYTFPPESPSSIRVFLYQSGSRTELVDGSPYRFKSPAGLNNFGVLSANLLTCCAQVAGIYLLSSGQTQLLGDVLTEAGAINDPGQVTWTRCDGVRSCFTLSLHVGSVGSGTTSTRIGQVSSGPLGINRPGHVVGANYFVSGAVITPLTGFTATSLNDLHQIGGWRSGSPSRAVIWMSGTLTDIGPGRVVGLNNVGQAIGWDQEVIAGDTDPFVYQSGARTNLRLATAIPSGWILTSLKTINDSGWIIGTAARCLTCARHAVLLKPTTPSAPTISLSPEDQSLSASDSSASTTFRTVANGNPLPTCQWQQSGDGGTTWTNLVNAGPWSGVTTNMLIVSSPTADLNDVRVRCIATNSAGTATTSLARLTVTSTAVAPTIVTQPISQTPVIGGTVTLSAAATGTSPLTYQWQRNGANVLGATQPKLVVANVQTSHAGSYVLVVTNAAGSATSAAATLTTPIELNSASIRFAATKAGANGALVSVTPPQEVLVTIRGSAPDWTATADQPWVQIVPSSGTGTGRFTVSIANPANVLGGTTSAIATITVTASSIGLTAALPVSLAIQLNPTAGAVPFGAFDTPTHNATGISGAIPVTGWALDDVGVNRVELWRNCVETIDRPTGACFAPSPGASPNSVFLGRAIFLSGARPDVEAVYGATSYPQIYRAGWGFLLLTNALPHLTTGAPQGGQGSFTLSAYAIDEEGHYTGLGQKTITLNNDGATLPFGNIDTPTQGETIPGPTAPFNNPSGYPNFGWALTQAGKCINTASTSAYRVFIDGVERPLTTGTNWFPGLNRSDIAAAFPGLCNSNDAVAAYYIDIPGLGLADGLHTIGWEAIDNLGNVGKFGSRFFNVLVGSPDAPATSGSDRPVALGSTEELRWLTPAVRTMRVEVGSGPTSLVSPNSSGQYSIRFPAGERIALDLGGPIGAGYQIVGNELRALPGGSSLDPSTGTFAWLPPVPYLGTFHLIFLQRGERIDVAATIADPTAANKIQVQIDVPAAGSTVSGPLTVAGWALDPRAAAGTGIDTLHVWAYRRDAIAEPQFVGAAAVGGSRPDVAATYGEQFEGSGFSLTALLPPGVYDVLVYPWAHRSGRFEQASVVRVIIR